jgi:hypothetical protein
MRLILLTISFLLAAYTGSAQVELNDFGRIVLNTHIPDNTPIPQEARALLVNKLNQMTTNYGMGGSVTNPRFVITATVDIGTKDIIAGPPQMIAQQLSLTIYIGDAVTKTLFSSLTLNLKGVGTNENKSFIEAIKRINSKSEDIKELLEEGKSEIISYYSANCDFILKEAQTLVKQEKYDEAIYQLSLVPDVCQDCYFKCLDTLVSVYQQKIDADCQVKFNEAKVIWTAAQTPNGAERAGDVLSTINPMASCQPEVSIFIKKVDAKLKADEKARWQFKMKQYADKVAAQKEQTRIAEEQSKRDDVYREKQAQRDAVANEKQAQRNLELDKIRVNAYREVAVAYAKNQPKRLLYDDIKWK